MQDKRDSSCQHKRMRNALVCTACDVGKKLWMPISQLELMVKGKLKTSDACAGQSQFNGMWAAVTCPTTQKVHGQGLCRLSEYQTGAVCIIRWPTYCNKAAHA